MSPSTPDLGEYTPGDEFSMGCHKDHWEFNAWEETADTYRTKMETAQTCEDYVHHKDKGFLSTDAFTGSTSDSSLRIND